MSVRPGIEGVVYQVITIDLLMVHDRACIPSIDHPTISNQWLEAPTLVVTGLPRAAWRWAAKTGAG